ncbi:uncharacterized protein LOC123545162 isoform X2 [Mercenaria mercenaria]|uniref:uncharacterized protein LOC123545162 isoform X2 n=1 Tax=Mercenaria mercenaria TaxID=6596 RepID=UPI00234E3A28|nr:uncharacterized protein LOC123545162 isoform X2 [Mercenaria mercenaria]
MTCDVTENDVENIYLIQILRETMSGSGNFESVVEMENADGPVLKVTNNKDFVAGGTYDLGNTDLSVSMNISKLQCNDAKTYKCALTYKSTTVSTPLTLEKNGTLSAYVYPNVKELEAERNGKEEYKGSLPTDKATFAIGDELELTCTATIGSLPATTISWRKTSEIGQTNNFIGYQPQAGTFDEGTAISDSECGYTRVATITYNTTVNDASRAEDNPLAFECYVSVSGNPYGTTYTTQNNPRFYADVSGDDETPSSDTATAGSGDAGVIAGSVVGSLVLIVIIVLLVYFLWYRRRNSGEDYTTKEEYGSENPNMAPPVDTYASVDKHRKSKTPEHGNGVDEPLKPKPKPRAGQQELHYAELDLTKNPPVAPRKKRNDPVEYAEVEFHK